MEQEGLNVGYLAYNNKVAPFDNVKVRKALNHAINKKKRSLILFSKVLVNQLKIRFHRLSGHIMKQLSMIASTLQCRKNC